MNPLALLGPPPTPYCKSNFFQFSRRYSVVVTQVTLLALNTFFLIAKATHRDKMGQTGLLLLSTLGVLSLHYYLDFAWKSFQDAHFAVKMKNWPITAVASARLLQTTSDVALTAGNFFAAVQGVSGHLAAQKTSYKNMIGWGEVTLATSFALTLTSLYITYRTSKNLGETGEKAASNIRFCMDKDTLWHLMEKIENETDLDQALSVVKENINTQLKVTLGSRLALMLGGYVLMAIEKYYTPNSLVAGAINFAASSGYAINIAVEKALEIRQRKKNF